ncbi:peptide-N4-asparagine amidase [Paractinoplanes ferrugineus]|uniref:peptide-N4-asparagine amidase n=1 Tax=Paractinoplanes ferrugineus TaxID=113564 RepID=UPI001EF3A339|nr:peptide-N4-asparagine amidase [Actinoplanes ferrugineus]
MRKLIILAAAGLVLTSAAPARAAGSSLAEPSAVTSGRAEPPAEFGSDWDDPRTAAPAIAKPATRSCTTTVVEHAFAGYDPYVSSYAPTCRGPWSKVVLRLDGNVKGRQYDRLGWLTIGGVEVFKTSTPEPSPDGITWSVEKDVTAYASLLKSPQAVRMYLGNTVDDTYTGVLNIKVSLTFYAGLARTADDVLPLADQGREGPDLTGTVRVAANTERLLAEVYATGSGGGCEEFWYLTAPSATGYSCPADPGPYREVQVLLDGEVAGIAAPFPHVYTGGWSNPFLWYVVPAPRAFDIRPISYDLTPYLGKLTDGAAHRVAVRVVGVPAGQSGWDTPINFLGWRDHGSARVTGGLLAARLSPLTNEVTGATGEVRTRGGHAFTATGYLRTSHGVRTSSVTQRVSNRSTHTWGTGENPDALDATWTDDATSVLGGKVTHLAQRFAVDGSITVGADNRLTTRMRMSDVRGPVTDTFTGEASWQLDVPRDQRHATATTQERYRIAGRYDKTIRTVNGTVL